MYFDVSYAREYSLGWWEAMKALVVFVGSKPFPSKFLGWQVRYHVYQLSFSEVVLESIRAKCFKKALYKHRTIRFLHNLWSVCVCEIVRSH